jgi:translation initiation factor 2 alpha subunit (eIF-2alpha)
MSLKEGDIVLCTVKRIEGTTVFLEIEDNGEGTMIFSEVSPGRIRNIRDYIVPNKKIVCKVLRIRDGHPDLSLRRVTAGERDEVMDRYKKSKVLSNMIKPILKEKTSQVLEKIKEKHDLADFLDEVRENPDMIDPFVSPSEVDQLKKIFSEKREKEKEVIKVVIAKSMSESGLNDLKSLFADGKAEIHYLGSSKFSVSVKAKDFKKANHELVQYMEQLRSKAKTLKVSLEIKEK